MDIVIDSGKAEKFYFNLRTGFAKNLTEILVEIGLVILILVLFVVFYGIQNRRSRKKEDEELAVMYARLRDKFHLTPDEEGLIEELSLFTKEPRKRYLLLTDRAVFNNAFASMRAKTGTASRDRYDALSNKLGFEAERRASALASTRDIPQGTKGVLALSKEEKFPVMVLDNNDGGISLSLLRGNSTVPPAGKTGRLYIQTATGISEFPTKIVSFSNGTFYISHSDKISDIQRRNFFRKSVGLNIVVSYRMDQNLSYDTGLLDLSGGGLSFVNPAAGSTAPGGSASGVGSFATGGSFAAGDEILVDFQDQLRTKLIVPTRVIRASRGGRVIHAEFIELKPAERDVIIGALNR